MITRYNSTCSVCHKPTKAGVDEYDLVSKKSYHLDCQHGHEPTTPDDSEALADRLGYRRYSWQELMDKLLALSK